MQRRQFLRGLGGLALSLPYLPSFMSKAQAQVALNKKRFFCIISRLGYYENNYYPALDADQRFANDVYYRTIASIPGDNISAGFGNHFNGLKSKMNIYRGLDVVGATVHSRVPALCSCKDDDGARGLASSSIPTGTSRSIDVVLGLSKNFYPTNPEFLALRGQDPGPSNCSFSFDRDPVSNERIMIPYSSSPRDIFNMVFADRAIDPIIRDRIKSGKLLIGDAVLADYKRLAADRRLASEDVRRLSNFIDNLQELHKNLNTQQQISCSTPLIETFPKTLPRFTSEDQKQRFYKNYFDVIISAMACNITSIGVVSISQYLHDHPLSHSSPKDPANQTEYNRITRELASLVKNCAEKMDSFIDPNGKTMLDNSLLYWTYEMSESASHRVESMPAVTFGSAGGNIKTGYYMDYRQRPFFHVHPSYPAIGRSHTQMFITFMRALGLTPDDYLKYGDGKGFGSFGYREEKTRALYAPYEGLRNQVLPFISNVA